MDTKDVIELNKARWKTQLSDLLNNIRPEIVEQFRHVHIYDSNKKEITLDDIDFSKPLLFISKVDFSYLISVLGLLKLNNVPFEDTKISGTDSRIRTTYMVVDSPTIRYSGLDNDMSYEELPDQWKPINYINKQLCIWRLLKEVGQGSNDKMYTYCSERIYNRYIENNNDWIFFIGTMKEYKETYNLPIDLNIYEIKLTKQIPKSERTDIF